MNSNNPLNKSQNSKTHYSVLELSRNASSDEIRESYKKLARKYHPDVNESAEAKDIFEEIQEAYRILKDINLKSEYDATLGTFTEEELSEFTLHEDSKALRKEKLVKGKEKEEVAYIKRKSGTDTKEEKSLFSEVKELLGFKKKKDESTIEKREAMPQKAIREVKGTEKNPYAQVATPTGEREYIFTVDALESVKGCSRKIVTIVDRKPYPIEVPIPSLTTHDSYIRVRKPSDFSNRPGRDLRVKIRLVPHTYLERKDLNLTLRVPVTDSWLRENKELEIYTILSNVKVQVPESIVRPIHLQEHGLKDKKTGRTGDLFVQFYKTDDSNWYTQLKESTELLRGIFK